MNRPGTSGHTIDTLNEKVDLLYATQQEALAKAFEASQLAILNAQTVMDAKITALGANQGDALKWAAGIIASLIAWAIGKYGK